MKYINLIDSSILAKGIIKNFDKHLDNSHFYFNGTYDGINKNVTSYDFKNKNHLTKIIDDINFLEKPPTVIVHYLNHEKVKVINSLNKNIKIIWCIWGYDLYEAFPALDYKVYDKETAEYVLKNTSFKEKILNKLKIKKFIFKSLLLFNKIKILPEENFSSVNMFNAIKRVDAISYIVPDEESFILHLGLKKPSLLLYHDPTYIVEHELTQDYLDKKQNILIGNSGALSNNHIDCFNHLSTKDLGDKKIIVPLNYGGNKKYINHVVAAGRERFGDNFVPLLERLPLEDYIELLDSCGIIMFNHLRQQAVGNLLNLIGRGSKIIFNKKNPVYSYYTSYQLNFETMDNFNLENIDLKKALENQVKIHDIYNEERLKKEFQKVSML